MKVCTKCNIGKELSDFYKDSQKADGFCSWCKLCKNSSNKRWQKENPEKFALLKKDARERNYLSYREAQYRWRRDNIELVRSQDRKRYAENIELNRARNREKYVKNPDAGKSYVRKWLNKNKWYSNMWSAKRRAAKKMATPIWANFKEIKEFYRLREMYSRCFGEEYHVDHIIPLKGKNVCGLHTEGNLQIITAKENLKKRNFFIVEGGDLSTS